MRAINKPIVVLAVLVTLVIAGCIFFPFQKQPQAKDRVVEPARYSDFLRDLVWARTSDTPIYSYRIVEVYPHDSQAYTQGLVFDRGCLYESTGLRGRSTLRQIELNTGEVLKMLRLPPRYFGEGLTLWQGRLVQLTWTSGTGFVYNKDTFQKLMEFKYSSEGWGLTQDGRFLIMSDGTAELRFLDPGSFTEVKRIEVHHGTVPIRYLNELEYIKGQIYANIWQTDYIARISPQTGQVLGWIDLKDLLGTSTGTGPADVLNGIAYDASENRIFVTGKLWPKLFEIELIRME